MHCLSETAEIYVSHRAYCCSIFNKRSSRCLQKKSEIQNDLLIITKVKLTSDNTVYYISINGLLKIHVVPSSGIQTSGSPQCDSPNPYHACLTCKLY